MAGVNRHEPTGIALQLCQLACRQVFEMIRIVVLINTKKRRFSGEGIRVGIARLITFGRLGDAAGPRRNPCENNRAIG